MGARKAEEPRAAGRGRRGSGGRARAAAAGALAGIALASLETLAFYLPAASGTDLLPEAGLPLLAALGGAAAGGLAGALHPAAGVLLPACLVAVATDPLPAAALLALGAGALGLAGARFPRAALAGILGLLLGAASLPRAEAARPGRSARPDILLVVLDTVGAAHTSLHGGPLPTTPVLERLAREGAWFRRAVATAPWTVPSHASLFTGEQPRTVGCHHEHPSLPEGVPTTAEILARAGYRTGAFVANPWVGPATGLVRGFDHTEATWELLRLWRSLSAVRALERLRRGEPGKGGALAVRRSLAWLGRAGEVPSFAFVNLLEAHSPFHRVPHAARFGVADPARVGERTHRAQLEGPDALGYPEPGELDAARRLHAAGVRHVDGLVGELLAGLEAGGRLERTFVIVTSDHGEAFGEHGFHGHLVGLYEETLHVPLVLRHPATVPAGTVVEPVVSLRAVHPTLVEVATGARHEGSLLDYVRGEGLAEVALSEQRRPLQLLADFRRGGARDLAALDRRALRVRAGDLVLLRERPAAGGAPHHAFFDLAADPLERRNLWPDPRALPLLALLDAHDALPVAGGADPELSVDLRARLEALGYLAR
jgi:arylsulfatase A-like enzyme